MNAPSPRRRDALALLAAAITLPSAVRAQTAPSKLVIGFTSRSANDWPIYVADKVGFFSANGIAIEGIVVGSSAGCAQQLTAGALDLGSVSSTQTVEAAMGGAPIVSVLNQMTTAPYGVLGKKGIASVAGLKGKTIIIGGPNDITRIFMDKVLSANGVRPDDVTYTNAGATSDRYAALLSGTVDAAILFPPFSFRAADEGYPLLDETAKYFPKMAFGGLGARAPWAAEHRDLLVAFMKAYQQGVRWLYDPANKTRAIAILIDATNAKPDDASKTYDAFVARLHVFSPTGAFGPGDYPDVVATLLATKQIPSPPAASLRFYDNSFADAATAGNRRK